MADTTVCTYTRPTNRFNPEGTFWISEDKGSVIFPENQGIEIYSTLDGGQTWTRTHYDFFESPNNVSFACYYDGDTPNDTGNLVHMVVSGYGANGGAGSMFYMTFNLDTYALGTKRTVGSWTTALGDYNTITITKSVSGVLHVVGADYSSNSYHYSSTDGITWATKASFSLTDRQDWLKSYPSNSNDDDIIVFKLDKITKVLSSHQYINSTNSIVLGATVTITGVNVTYKQFNASIRHSDRHIITVLLTDLDDPSTDVWIHDWNVSSTPSYTQKTTVVENIAESASPIIVINQQNDDLYVAYIKGGSLYSLTDVYFHTSEDGGTTWSSATKYNSLQDDIREIGGSNINNCGGRIQFVFFNSDLADTLVNLDNDIAIEENTGTNSFINIGDDFKEISEMQINIGDSWKPVVKGEINIGDSWKQIF